MSKQYKYKEEKEQLYYIGNQIYKIKGNFVFVQKTKTITCFYRGGLPPTEKYWEISNKTPKWVIEMSKKWRKIMCGAVAHFQEERKEFEKEENLSKRFERRWLVTKGNKFKEYQSTILKLFDHLFIEQYFVKMDKDNFVQFKKIIDSEQCVSFYRIEIYGEGIENEFYGIETTVDDYELNKRNKIGNIFKKERYSTVHNDYIFKIDIYTLKNDIEKSFLKVDFPNIDEAKLFILEDDNIVPKDLIEIKEEITSNTKYNLENIIKNGFEILD